MGAIDAIGPAGNSAPSLRPEREAALRETARAFEAAFLTQMLAHSGLGKTLGANAGFGGEAFSTLLVEQYAARLVERGGVGLAETIYAQLRDKETAHVDRTID